MVLAPFQPMTTSFPPHAVLLSFLFGFCVSCAAGPSASRKPQFTATEREIELAAFDQVWTTVRDQYWDPKMAGIDWEGVRVELEPAMREASNRGATRAIMNQMLGRLGQSHFGVFGGEPPEEADSEPRAAKPSAGSGAGKPSAKRKPTREKPKSTGPSNHETGCTLRALKGQAVVTHIEPDSPADQAGVKLGWILRSIAGRPVQKVISSMAKRPKSSASDLYMTMALNAGLRGTAGETRNLVFEDGDGEEVTLDVGVEPPRGTLTRLGNLGRVHVICDFHRRDDNIGYVRLSAFMDPTRVMAQFEKAIRSFVGCKGVIIDLRGNPGGLGIMASGLAGWFVSASGKSLGRMATRAGEMKFAIFPRALSYPGPLAVVIDGASASTSEIFAAGMKDLGRARIFGSTSAGAALPSVIAKLPNGDRFQYAIANCWSANGHRIEGKGVEPHEIVEQDRSQLLQGRDAVIDAAVRWIGNAASNK